MQAPEPPFLIASDVACRRGDRVLFRGLSFELAPGDVLHVKGANGVGKSSLLRMLAGLLTPFAGKIEARGALGLLDDRPALDPDLTLGKALDFWRNIDQPSETPRAYGLDHLLDVPVRYLSTGQKKRAGLARLDLQGPPIWLLDEPLNGLDKDAVAQFGAVLDEHRRADAICVLASHQPFPLDDMRVIDLADYVPSGEVIP